jgi:hypothetical protein
MIYLSSSYTRLKFLAAVPSLRVVKNSEITTRLAIIILSVRISPFALRAALPSMSGILRKQKARRESAITGGL